MNIKAVLFFLAIVLVFSAPLYADSRGHKDRDRDNDEWRKMPHKVQQTVAGHVAGGRVFEVKTENMVLMDNNKKTSATLYLVGIKKPDGGETWVIADKDGKVIDVDHVDGASGLEEDIDNERKERRRR
ncbi:hypothetical protein ABF87_02130 [Nitrosomonas sp. JL21]|nr:hypothetical protein [Nitrosomonas sp. JL21]